MRPTQSPLVKPAYDDLEHRRPVWQALSELFLDTDPSVTREERIRALSGSPYSVDELEQILRDEVLPVCRANLASVAGEWAGFDPQWLESSILRRFRFPWRLCRRFSRRKLPAPLATEWHRTVEGIVRQRTSRTAV